MNYDQQLLELRKKENQLLQKERAIIKETRKLEEDLNRFEAYSYDANRFLWNVFESYTSSRNFFDHLQEEALHESRKISTSYLEEIDELAIQKRKVEDDLNDIYHERKKLMIEKECDDGN